MKIARVKFKNFNFSSFCFYDEKLILKKNLSVIVESNNKGLLFGFIEELDVESNDLLNTDLDKIIRIASKKDYNKYLSNNKDAIESIDVCKKYIDKYKLSMNILDANYNFDRSQLIFRFVADERVDFRNLAKDLGSIFKTRIELRQIGVRDKAKEIGGFGPCGRILCCSSFLSNFSSVSINMAKNQGVSLNPNKINGVCGRLLCCLNYENDVYSDLKKNLPNVGAKIIKNGIEYKVTSVNVFKNSYVLSDSNKNSVEVFND